MSNPPADRSDSLGPDVCFDPILREMREALVVLEPLLDDQGCVSDVRCAFVNEAFCALARCSADSVDGLLLREIRTEREFAWLDRCERAVKSGGADSFSLYDVVLDKWLDLRVFALRSDRFILLIDDVTPKRVFQTDSETEYSVLRTLTKLTKMTEDFLFTLDPGGRFTGVFGKWIEENGYDASHFIGKGVAEVLGDAAEEAFESALLQAVMNGHTEYRWTFRTKTKREPTVLQVFITPIEQVGLHYGMLGIGRDISSLMHKQNELNRALQEKTVLLQEVLHRVNNNLQLIISLIELQLTGKDGRACEAQLALVKSRIYAMSSVHDSLAASSSNDTVLLRDLMDKLSFLFDSRSGIFARMGFGVVDIDDRIALPVETAIPVALILHEHFCAFCLRADPGAPSLAVSVRARLVDGNRCEMTLGEPAAGCACEGADMSEMLIEGLVAQIKGTVESVSGESLRRYSFPLAGAGHPQVPVLQ